jgi:hypothetical protein
MLHHVIYWRMAKRETDVDDEQLADLCDRERRSDVYVEFVDGERRPHVWDVDKHRWLAKRAA